MSSNKFPGLPDPPTTADPAVRKWMEDVTDMLRQGTGQAGSSHWVTFEDLEETGVVDRLPGTGGATQPPGQGGSGEGVFVPKPQPPMMDDTPPPKPKNVKASGSPTAVRVRWDDPKLDYSYRAEINASKTDDVGTSVLVGSSNGMIYEHIIGTDLTPNYYWVRFVKSTGEKTIIGQWNQTRGIVGQIAGQLQDAQLGQLDVDKIVGGTAEFVAANILNGSITNAKIGDTIQSNNYVPGTAGWIIKK